MTAALLAGWIVGRIFALAAITATVWALGTILLRRLPTTGTERLALALAAGLAAWGHILWLLGMGGWLRAWSVALLALAAHWAARQEWWRVAAGASDLLGRVASPTGVVLLLLAAPCALLPLYPPTEFDALVYHLPYAQGFVDSGGMPFFETLLYPAFPQHQELLFAAVMLFGTATDAQLTSLLALIVTCLFAWEWGRRASGPVAGAIAAGLWIGTPLVVWHGGTAYVDLALALYGTAGLYAWQRQHKDGRDGWTVLAGLFAATAAATKLLGLFFVGYLGIALLAAAARRRQTVRHLLAALALMALLTGAWYGRIWALTGNPMFPYYASLFGSSAWNPPSQSLEERDGLLGGTLHTATEGIDDIILLPWDMVFRRQIYNRQAPFNPWLLVLLPVGLVAALAQRANRRQLAAAGLFLVAWTITTREPRFVLAVLPVLGVALGSGLALASRRFPVAARSTTALLLFCAVAAPGPLYAAWKVSRRGAPPVSAADRHAYLQRSIPGYAATAWLDDRLGDGYTAMAWEAPWLVYHARGTILGSAFGPEAPRRLVGTKARSPGAILTRLRSSEVDWVIETSGWGGEPRRLPPWLAPVLRPAASGPGWTVYEVIPRR